MIVLFAFGKRGYAHQAYNLAFSLKYFSPGIPVTVFHDGVIDKLPEEKKIYFDSIIKIENVDVTKFKTLFYELSPYEETLYLDVDAVALKPIEPLISELQSQDFYTHIQGEHKLSDGNKMPSMLWAYANDIISHFKLNPESKLVSTNTSIIWFKKTPEVKNLFEQWKLNLDNPIPLGKLRHQWGAAQPDELYLNIALNQTGIEVNRQQHIFFGGHLVNKTFGQLTDDNYFLSVYGGRGFTKLRYTDWYDRKLQVMHNEKGLQHSYTYFRFVNDKHANKTSAVRNINEQSSVHNSKKLQKALIPISETILIDSKKLIQSYPDSRGKINVITNWLNCSAIEFKGKKYFAYRMESKPWCMRMKIGLCLLDDDLQPIQETNVLLNLHSELTIKIPGKGETKFEKGFHVEDPRLFIFNNELYLSYTDGYQMAQAKINPDTLQAEDSFYLDKPNKERTEKNWTFFEHEMKLHCLYDINKQHIFEVYRERRDRSYQTEFKHEWKYGDIKGGTSPVRYGENFITFFHSTTQLRYNNRDSRQYFMGALIFEAKPPFKPISISKEPFICGELVDMNIPRLNNNIFVVFPSGLIRKENSFSISFGYNDFQCRFVEVTDEMISQNMTPVIYPQYSSAFDNHEKISGTNKGNGHIKIAEHA